MKLYIKQLLSILLLFIFTMHSYALTVYKCINNNGETAFSSTQCVAGDTQETMNVDAEANVIENDTPAQASGSPDSGRKDSGNKVTTTGGTTVENTGGTEATSTAGSNVSGTSGGGGSAGGGDSSGSGSGSSDSSGSDADKSSDDGSNADSGTGESISESTTTISSTEDSSNVSVPSGDDSEYTQSSDTIPEVIEDDDENVDNTNEVVEVANPGEFILVINSTNNYSLSFISPAQKNNGDVYDNPGGHKLYISKNSDLSNYKKYVLNPNGKTSINLNTTGTHFISVAAMNVNGVEGGLSKIKSIQVN